MIIRIKPDKQRAESLKKMAEITLERLKNIDRQRYPSNTLLDYYDSLHKLMEALSLKEGIKTKGEGAHQELIEYMAKKGIINEQTRQFLQQMREYRNKISYEGFMINKNYILLNESIIREIIKKLFDSLN